MRQGGDSAQNDVEVKAPHEAIFDLPQERITGDILRGRGPRRGNLETLIKYWRPIMRKPGGFRRCLVILADHPELYPLERICAWLHHETTGMWPNEGNHHAGGKLGKIVKRTVKKPRRRKRGKSDVVEAGIDFNVSRIERRLERKAGSIICAPLDGTDAQIDFKSSKAKRVVSAMESVFLPGEHGALKPRHIGATLLTPGGSGLPGPKFGFKPGRGLRGSAGNTRGFRCPPGFERGGHFTDSRFSTCGRQLFGVPGSGRSALRTVSAQVNAQQREKVGDAYAEYKELAAAPPEEPKAGVGGGMPELPETVGPANPEKQTEAVSGVLESMSSQTAPTDKPVRRLVREDGSILQPLAPLDVIGKQKNNPDLRNAALLTRVNRAGAFGKDELALMQTGLSSIEFSLPGGGSVSLKRNGGPMPPGKARAFGKAISTASKSEGDSLDYAALLRETAARTDAVTYTVNLPGERDPARLVRVTGGESDERVPYWVFKTFLEDGAPGKGADAVSYTMAEPVGKSLKASAVKRLGGDVLTTWGPLQYTAALIPDYDEIDRTVGVRYKAIAYTGYRRDITWAFVEEKRASSVWDRGINRFRCPPGMTNAGQITNRLGLGCGKAVMDRLFNVLRGTGSDVVRGEAGSVRFGRRRDRANVPGRGVNVPGDGSRFSALGNRIESAIRGDAPDEEFGTLSRAASGDDDAGFLSNMLTRMMDVIDTGAEDELAEAVLEGRRSRRDLEREERGGVTDRIRTALSVEDVVPETTPVRSAPIVREERDPGRIVEEVDSGVSAPSRPQITRESRRLAADTPETARTLFDAQDRDGLEAMRLRHEANRTALEAALRTPQGILTTRERFDAEAELERSQNFESLATRFVTRLDANATILHVDPFVIRDNTLPAPRTPDRPVYDVGEISFVERNALTAAVQAYRVKVDGFWETRIGPEPTVAQVDDYVRDRLGNPDILPGHRNTLLRYREDWGHFQNVKTDGDLLEIPNKTSNRTGRQLLIDASIARPDRRTRIAPDPEPLVTNTPGDGRLMPTPETPEITSVATSAPWVPSAELSNVNHPRAMRYDELRELAVSLFPSTDNQEEILSRLTSSRARLAHQADLYESGGVDNPDALLLAMSEVNDLHAAAVIRAGDRVGVSQPTAGTSGRNALGVVGSAIPGMDEQIAVAVAGQLRELERTNTVAFAALTSRPAGTHDSVITAVMEDSHAVSGVLRPLDREIDGLARARQAARIVPQARQARSGEYVSSVPDLSGRGRDPAPAWAVSEYGVNLNAAGFSRIYGDLDEGEWGNVPFLRVEGVPDENLEVQFTMVSSSLVRIKARDKTDLSRHAFVTLSFAPYREEDGTFAGRVDIHANRADSFGTFQNLGVNDALTTRLIFGLDGAGIGRIDTYANVTIGNYAWARKGFEFDQDETPGWVKDTTGVLRDFLNDPGSAPNRALAERAIYDAIGTSLSGANMSDAPADRLNKVTEILASYIANKDMVLASLDKVVSESYTAPIFIASIGAPVRGQPSVFPTAGNNAPFHPGRVIFLADHLGWTGTINPPRPAEEMLEALRVQ